MTQNQPLLSEALEATPAGLKALLFAFKLYLLPSGDLQTAVSNVDPATIRTVFTEAEMEIETININVGAIKFLLNEVPFLEKKLDEYLKAL